MLEKYNHHFYRSIRLIIFAIIAYGLLKYVPTNAIVHNDMIKMTILFVLLFIAIDCYWPNIYYDKDQ